MNSANPQRKPINQQRGPTTGNGIPSKRNKFAEMKKEGDVGRTELANMITGALESKGRNLKNYVQPGTEPVAGNYGPKTNPTSNGSKLPGKFRKRAV